MEKLQFDFYSILKNEDAQPYIINNYLFAADGLGGSGAFKHELSDDMRNKVVDNLKKSAFFDFDYSIVGVEEFFVDYVDKLINVLLDDEMDSSARWASSVVTVRAIYALNFDEKFKNADLSKEEVREELSNYLHIGLQKTAEEFGFVKGPLSGQLLLPTTLCFIKYIEQEDSVVAEVVWAGDSRCYAIVNGELKSLSVDDENQGGAITNLFYVEEGYRAKLNYKQFTLSKPCSLMCVSDGIFDPFGDVDTLGVEATFFRQIVDNESIGELCMALKEEYEEIGGDDATVAFVGLGYKDYNHLKQTISGRAEEIIDFWQKYNQLQKEISLLEKPEESLYNVKSRTIMRYPQIMPIVLDCIEQNSSEIFVKPIKEFVLKQVKDKLEKQILQAQERKESLLNGLGGILDYPLSLADSAAKICYEIRENVKNKEQIPFTSCFSLAHSDDFINSYLQEIESVLADLNKVEELVVQAETSISEIVLPEAPKKVEIEKIKSKVIKSCLNIKKSFLEYTKAIKRVVENITDYYDKTQIILSKVKEVVSMQKEFNKEFFALNDSEKSACYNEITCFYSICKDFDTFAQKCFQKKLDSSSLKIRKPLEVIAKNYYLRSCPNNKNDLYSCMNNLTENVKKEREDILDYISAFISTFSSQICVEDCIGLLSDKIIQEKSIKELCEIKVISRQDECFSKEILENLLIEYKDEICDIIQNCFKENYFATSIIDNFYNKTFLQDFRTWYKIANMPKEELEGVSEKANEYMENYFSLCK